MRRPRDPGAEMRPPASYALLAFVLLTMTWLGHSARAEAIQSEVARTCLRINDNPIEGDWDERAKIRETWVAACRQAAAAEPANPRLKHVLARSLMTIGRRDEAIVIWRELAEHDDADAAFEIYDMYKSYYRGDVNAPQLVTRAEAERALRRAAELGHAYATLILAVLLDRGGTVKRDPQEAIRFAERAVANPSKDVTAADMQVLLGRLLVKSSDPEQKARGVALLERLAQAGQWNAKAELAIAIRDSDPARARALLEQSLQGNGGGAIPPLADMLIKGEGGPADPRRAVALLSDRRYSDVPGISGARGELSIAGKLVPRDLKNGVDLLSLFAQWDFDARMRLLKLLADNPDLTIAYPGSTLYDATEAAELGEPGAMAALIELKLSRNAQFRDKEGGCALAARAAKDGDAASARWRAECGAN
jgi:TPR repeat protein